MNDNEQLRHDMEAYLNHQQATDVGDVADALVVHDEGEDAEDTLLEAMTQAVQPAPQYLGDEGTPTGTTTSTPHTSGPPTGLSLNAGTDGDDALTQWLNNMSR